MYQLYCAPQTYAMGPHVLLEELDVDYEVTKVTLCSENQPEDFLQASPHGRVPALRHEHGTVFESGAIALFLADAHADKGFTIAEDDPDRARFLQWMFYLSSTVQPDVMLQFHPEVYFEEDALQQKLKQAASKNLYVAWRDLNHAYRSGPWLLDNRPTAVDYCLAIQLQWPECFKSGISEFPNLERMYKSISARAAWQKMLEWHGSE